MDKDLAPLQGQAGGGRTNRGAAHRASTRWCGDPAPAEATRACAGHRQMTANALYCNDFSGRTTDR